MTIKELGSIRQALQFTVHWQGSAQLRAGAAFMRAGVKGFKYVGVRGGEHVFRRNTGETVLIDMVAVKVTQLLTIMRID